MFWAQSRGEADHGDIWGSGKARHEWYVNLYCASKRVRAWHQQARKDDLDAHWRFAICIEQQRQSSFLGWRTNDCDFRTLANDVGTHGDLCERDSEAHA